MRHSSEGLRMLRDDSIVCSLRAEDRGSYVFLMCSGEMEITLLSVSASGTSQDTAK